MFVTLVLREKIQDFSKHFRTPFGWPFILCWSIQAVTFPIQIGEWEETFIFNLCQLLIWSHLGSDWFSAVLLHVQKPYRNHWVKFSDHQEHSMWLSNTSKTNKIPDVSKTLTWKNCSLVRGSVLAQSQLRMEFLQHFLRCSIVVFFLQLQLQCIAWWW